MLCYAKSLQSCPTMCDPIDGSPPGSTVPGILQAIILEWVAISFSNAWKRQVKVKSLSHVRLLATPWTAAYQVPPSMGFSRQEYWSGVPLPSCYYCLSLGETEWLISDYHTGLFEETTFCSVLQKRLLLFLTSFDSPPWGWSRKRISLSVLYWFAGFNLWHPPPPFL